MIVMKFGGTSNTDATAMKNVINIVASHVGRKPVVVISAIARATNNLEEIARTAAAGDEAKALDIVARLFDRHREIMRGLLGSTTHVGELESVFDVYRGEIVRLVKGLAILRELTPRTMDAVCSYGERLSSRIVAAGLAEQGIRSEWIDVKEFMITDERFGRAVPLMDVVQKKALDLFVPFITDGHVPVTQGFIGVTESGQYTTMGRESSDYSAAIIGAVLDAEVVQIWTDVDGILSADPRMVASARKIKTMSFDEAFELSYFGAKILHPNTMLPLIDKKIPVQILNSFRGNEGGTTIGMPEDATIGGRVPVKSITVKSGLVLVSVTPHRRHSQYHFWEGIYGVLNRFGVVVGASSTSEYKIAFVIEEATFVSDVHHALADFGLVEVSRNQASISFIGKDLCDSADLISIVFGALGGVRLSMISLGASDSSFTIVLEKRDSGEVVNRLHDLLFGGSPVLPRPIA